MVAGRTSSPATPGYRQRDLGHAVPTDEDVVQRAVQRVGVEAQGEGQTGLGVEIDDQGASSELGRGHPERVHRRGLGHATLLVGHGQHVGHGRSLRLARRSATTRVRIRPCPPPVGPVGVPPIEPKNGAEKLKTPPSAAANR